MSGIKNAAEEHFDGEVNRLLVLVSVSARQLLGKSPEISEKLANSACGKFWDNYAENAKPAPLHFRHACNAVIHAAEISPCAFSIV